MRRIRPKHRPAGFLSKNPTNRIIVNDTCRIPGQVTQDDQLLSVRPSNVMPSPISTPTIPTLSPVYPSPSGASEVPQSAQKEKSRPSSPTGAHPGEPSVALRIRSQLPRERESLETALHAINSALHTTRMLNPVVHIPDDATERESILKKYSLEESTIFQTVKHLLASEQMGATDRPVDANPYPAEQVLFELVNAKITYNKRAGIAKRASDMLKKLDALITSLEPWSGPPDLKPRLEKGYKKKAVNVIEQASREFDENHQKLLSLARNTNKFKSHEARDEYVVWVTSALMYAVSDKATHAINLVNYRPDRFVDIAAERKNIDLEIEQLKEIERVIEEKKLDPTHQEGDESTESLDSRWGQKYELIGTRHANLKERIKEEFPRIALDFWEIFFPIHEAVKVHVECHRAGSRFTSPILDRLYDMTTLLLTMVANFQAASKEELRPLICTGFVTSMSAEHKQEDISASKEAQLSTPDYSQLSWSSRFVHGLDDIRAYETAVQRGVGSFLGMPGEKQNAEGRQTALDLGSKLVEIGNAYRDVLLNLEEKFSDENLAELPDERRQECQKELTKIRSELQYKSYLLEATGFLMSTYAESFIERAPKREPEKHGTLAHIHEIQQSVNEASQDEKTAGKPEQDTSAEPVAHEEPDHSLAITGRDRAVQDTGKNTATTNVPAVSGRASSPKPALESRKDKSDKKRVYPLTETRGEGKKPDAVSLVAQASTFYEEFKNSCRKADREIRRDEAASNFLTSTNALFEAANHYTDAAKCCNEAQRLLQDAGRSHLPIASIKEKPVGIDELQEKCAYYLDEALLHFHFAKDPKSKRPSEKIVKKIDDDGKMQLESTSNFFRRVGENTPNESMIVEGKLSYADFKCSEVKRSLPIKKKYVAHVHFDKDLKQANLEGLSPEEIAPLITMDEKGRANAHIKSWAQRYKGNQRNPHRQENDERVVYESLSREYAAQLVHRILNNDREKQKRGGGFNRIVASTTASVSAAAVPG